LHSLTAMLRFGLSRLSLGVGAVGLASAAALTARPAEASFFGSKPKNIAIHYFPIQGPAEPARLALVLGGIPFEDVRHKRPAMIEMRDSGELPYGQLPIMYVDGKKLSQSVAIGQWCAKQAGLVPKDDFEAATVDSIVQFILQDVRERVIRPSMSDELDAAKKAAMRKECHEKLLPAKFAMLEKQVGDKGFLVGDKVTMADLHFYVLANWIGMGVLDGITGDCLRPFPKLTALVKSLNEVPEIKKWNSEKNPKLPCY